MAATTSASTWRQSQASDVALDDMMDKLWGPRTSVAERFPGSKGRVLWDMVVKAYAVEHSRTLHFYKDLDGVRTRLLYRHPRNNREQRSTTEAYVKSIMENGLLSANRSSAFSAAPNWDDPDIQKMKLPNDLDVRLLFAHAHLAEAVYEAESREPGNIQVQRSVEGGSSGPPTSTKRRQRTSSGTSRSQITLSIQEVQPASWNCAGLGCFLLLPASATSLFAPPMVLLLLLYFLWNRSCHCCCCRRRHRCVAIAAFLLHLLLTRARIHELEDSQNASLAGSFE